ncbi:hypothetical protein [Celeribacter sp.]|uniref:hypothetical protein n=1 Tax=Celeribacter sp. TaxID=1890673 RepID=UPI003A93CEDE
MTYSIALASLAASVFWGHRLYDRVTPAIYVAIVGTVAAVGCAVAALGSSIVFAWIGFGVVFGGANGMGYGYALQLAGRAFPQGKGFAMGIATASYALGAVVFPLPLRIAIDFGGWTAALLFLAVCLVVFSAASALVLSRSLFMYFSGADGSVDIGVGTLSRPQTIWLWLSYCGAVTAGLMAIGHASGLTDSRGGGRFGASERPSSSRFRI